MIDRDDKGKGTFHIDVVRRFGEKKKPASSDEKTIVGRIETLFGTSSASLLFGRFKVPPEIPIIPALAELPIGQRLDGQPLTLDGVRMRVEDEVFEEIFLVNDPSGGGKIVSLEAIQGEFSIDEEFLIRAERILRGGLDRFVIGKTD